MEAPLDVRARQGAFYTQKLIPYVSISGPGGGRTAGAVGGVMWLGRVTER
jgi:hypothetical protein